MIEYVYTVEGPIIALCDIAELSTTKFQSPESLESELKSSIVLPSNSLHILSKSDKFYCVDLDDVLNKQLAGIHDYSILTDFVRKSIVDSWIQITGKHHVGKK